VGRVAALLAAELGLAPDAVEDVRVAGLIHDVGKIGMADELLSAGEVLDAARLAELRRHPEIGERMLTGSRLANVAPWIRHHHERMDGGGYPDGLAGEAIPIAARIVAIADQFDMLTSARAYKPAYPVDEAVRQIEAQRGTRFDPACVDALVAELPRFVEILEAFPRAAPGETPTPRE
jgi:HD-GYP domain-containing protein (c-di-GMP phosphodiesterase class II)